MNKVSILRPSKVKERKTWKDFPPLVGSNDNDSGMAVTKANEAAWESAINKTMRMCPKRRASILVRFDVDLDRVPGAWHIIGDWLNFIRGHLKSTVYNGKCEIIGHVTRNVDSTELIEASYLGKPGGRLMDREEMNAMACLLKGTNP